MPYSFFVTTFGTCSPLTASSAKEPRLEEECSEGGAGAESGDKEGGGHVFEQSYD